MGIDMTEHLTQLPTADTEEVRLPKLVAQDE
jgi:hypothetical protein